jgi:hypothetical protein
MADGPEIYLTKHGPFYRVRVEPRDALPDHIFVSETHVGLLSANLAARLLSNATGFPINDHTAS